MILIIYYFFFFQKESLEFLSQPVQEIQYSLQQQRNNFLKICTFLFKAMSEKGSGLGKALKAQELQQILKFCLSFTGQGPIYLESKDKELKMKESFLEKVKDRELAIAEDQFHNELKQIQLWSNKVSIIIINIINISNYFLFYKGIIICFKIFSF